MERNCKSYQSEYNAVGEKSPRLFYNSIRGNGKDENQWFTTKKASAYLGISPNALRILVHRGKVEAFKIGTHLRFSLEALQALLLKKEY
ncbi:MAG: hypothetical protein A2X86_13030 [Bdellovibrionales bacterium GWA2_49_15]|nr:MAG: hypothetical protein A2X86_13030 [Bdellovibrionales bacterium GWA2_49_15]HAZ13909.1 hypothetical protein [Bdellovibrionales bacterium]